MGMVVIWWVRLWNCSLTALVATITSCLWRTFLCVCWRKWPCTLMSFPLVVKVKGQAKNSTGSCSSRSSKTCQRWETNSPIQTSRLHSIAPPKRYCMTYKRKNWNWVLFSTAFRRLAAQEQWMSSVTQVRIDWSIYLPTYLSTYLSVYLSFIHSFCLFIYLLFICFPLVFFCLCPW